jgi:predicted lipoprotein with Yx(FWY)xxD motif
MLTGWRAGVLGVVSAAVLAGSWLGATSAFGAPAHLPKNAVVFKTEHVSGVRGVVLAENNGQVVYTFNGDKRGHAGTCKGACAAIWPPVRGVAFLAHGVKIGGKFGRINGQITYNGWPLYLFTGAKPKQDNASNGFKVVKPTPWHSSPGPTPSPTPPTPGPTPTSTYTYMY